MSDFPHILRLIVAFHQRTCEHHGVYHGYQRSVVGWAEGREVHQRDMVDLAALGPPYQYRYPYAETAMDPLRNARHCGVEVVCLKRSARRCRADRLGFWLKRYG